MASGNQVTLDFAADTTKLDKAFSGVGAAADKMSAKVKESGSKIDAVGESTDHLATKTGTASGAFGALASGFQLAGVQSGPALAAVGALQLGFDAASGASDLLTLALESQKVKQIGATAATIAHNIAQKAAATASTVWTGAQWLLNAALDANPIGLIVIAIIALIAIIVIIATKTHWFQDIWHAAWGGIKTAASDVGDWFVNTLWKKWILGAWNGITGAGDKAVGWFKSLPGKLKTAFIDVGNIVFAPFRWAFNKISDAWNNTAGGLSFSVPSWVPGIGGKGFSLPKLPHFHTGGVVPGTPGQEVLAVLQAGETVTPAGRGGSGSVTVYAGDALTRAIMAAIRAEVSRFYSGDPALAFGGV